MAEDAELEIGSSMKGRRDAKRKRLPGEGVATEKRRLHFLFFIVRLGTVVLVYITRKWQPWRMNILVYVTSSISYAVTLILLFLSEYVNLYYFCFKITNNYKPNIMSQE